MYKFKKLVAVAEEMATQWTEAGQSVEGIDVQVEDNHGVVRVGVFGIVGVSFSSDDNVHFPEYGIDYKSYEYEWIEETWVRKQPKFLSAFLNEAEEELPF